MTSVEPAALNESEPTQRPLWGVHTADARATNTFLARASQDGGFEGRPFLTATITSPPYANLVDYGPSSQIGHGQSYEEYLTECEAVFNDLFRWTKDDGSLWVVADTMMSRAEPGKPSSLVPLPFALAARASSAGWVLRDVIIWRKDRTRPWASRGRLRNAFEYVLYFVKSENFKHHVDRLRDIRSLKQWWVKYPERHNPWGMTPDNVWDIPIPVQGSWASSELRHACPFPDELVRRIVELSTDHGDVVFDPFAGSGMVPAVAEQLGRLPLGTELNPEFARVYEKHVRPATLAAKPQPLDVDATDVTGKLLSLRVLKYPKILMSQLQRAGVDRAHLLGAVVLPGPLDATPRSAPYAELDCIVVLPDELSPEVRTRIEETLSRVIALAPLSRWSVVARVETVELSSLAELVGTHETFATYLRGRTWNFDSVLRIDSLTSWLREQPLRGLPPVLSPVQLKVELEGD